MGIGFKKNKVLSYKDPKRDLVVITSVTSWEEPPRIRHQVTNQLTRFFNVLYIELPFPSQNTEELITQISENLIVLKCKRPSRLFLAVWNRLPLVHRLYNNSIVKKISNSVACIRVANRYLINFQHDFPEIMKLPFFKKVIYLCNDDFLTSKGWINKLQRRYEEQVIKNADVCLAVSTSLVKKIEGLASDAKLFLPGHNFKLDTLNRISTDDKTDTIRLCYMGFINKRLRFDWLECLLQDDRYSITLIGNNEAPAELSKLAQYKNLVLYPSLQEKKLLDAMKSSDVFLIPYDFAAPEVIAISAPNKIFQYFACGKPVVISNMPNFLTFPDKFVYKAATAQEFKDLIYKAYQEDNSELHDQRILYANLNSWDVRGEELYDILIS